MTATFTPGKQWSPTESATLKQVPVTGDSSPFSTERFGHED